LCWAYVVAFTKVFTIYQIYHAWIHPIHHSPLSPLFHSWNSFSRSHFSVYTHAYTLFAPNSPSYTLSQTLPLPLPWVLSAVLWFCKSKKKKKGLFFWNSYKGIFLVIFPCMDVLIIQLVHHLYFSPFYLCPFLMVISTGLKILCSLLYRKYFNYVHLFNFLLLPSFSCMWPSLSVTCFSQYYLYVY
jgi:hypothetical protein